MRLHCADSPLSWPTGERPKPPFVHCQLARRKVGAHLIDPLVKCLANFSLVHFLLQLDGQVARIGVQLFATKYFQVKLSLYSVTEFQLGPAQPNTQRHCQLPLYFAILQFVQWPNLNRNQITAWNYAITIVS